MTEGGCADAFLVYAPARFSFSIYDRTHDRPSLKRWVRDLRLCIKADCGTNSVHGVRYDD